MLSHKQSSIARTMSSTINQVTAACEISALELSAVENGMHPGNPTIEQRHSHPVAVLVIKLRRPGD
jgi:hypothetical protein